MFSLKDFVKKGLLDAVGKQADYWVILNAVGWLEKGVLDENDLAEINAKIEAYHAAEEIPEEEIIEEEVTEDVIDEEVTEEDVPDEEVIEEEVTEEEEVLEEDVIEEV